MIVLTPSFRLISLIIMGSIELVMVSWTYGIGIFS